MQINAQAVATSNERVDNIAKLTIAAGVAISVLEVAGIPAFSITLVGAGCLFVAWVAKRQWIMSAAQPLPLPDTGLQIPDEDLRHAMLAREKAVDIRLNAAHRRISRFVYDALLYSMNAANTTDPHKLYAVASKAYQDLNPPFTLFHDLVLEVVIKWCVQHRCIPSPLPESWQEYADMLGQLQQNMAVTSDPQNVTAHVRGLLKMFQPCLKMFQTMFQRHLNLFQTMFQRSQAYPMSCNSPQYLRPSLFCWLCLISRLSWVTSPRLLMLFMTIGVKISLPNCCGSEMAVNGLRLRTKPSLLGKLMCY